MKKLAHGFNTTAQGSNAGSRSRESEALPLSYCYVNCHLLASSITRQALPFTYVTAITAISHCFLFNASAKTYIM